VTGVVVLVGLLTGVALLAGTWPGRRVVGVAGRGDRRRAGASVERNAAPGGGRPARRGPPGRRRFRFLRFRKDRRADGGGLAASLVEVAAVLRTGVAPADAWSAVLGVPVPDRVPTVAQLTAAAPADGAPLEAVIAAARVADELGAPLATVLDQVAAAIAAQAEAAADVEAALAGPRSSARVLAWLPVLGVLLGTMLGADPVGALLGGGLGTAAGCLGVVLMLAGRWWTSALLRRAGHAGDDP
jgi:tight adherence protein B